ncbi:hypothetical protein CASFOL_024998 [Castilleja foliolosa]|uniref:F-box domain-containing protein n=1 Tax=Castilleja foliolosa TaxID=1961234 RepID=A0ABD3CSE1_9LAMI
MGNWANLPSKLLDVILSNVFAKDRFSLVCRSWNTVATTSPSHYLVPSMMYYYRRTHTWKFHLHNTSFFTTFPELKHSEIHCSKHGWLLMARNDNTLFFFDPFNNRSINLACKIGFGYNKLFFFHPPTSPDCIVVGIKTPVWKQANPVRTQAVELCVLKHGKDEWEHFEFPTKNEYMVSNAPPVLHRGQIYFLDTKGDVARFDIIKRRFVISDKYLRLQRYGKVKEQYLFKVKGDEALFGVFVFHDERTVKVCRLSEGPSKNMNVLMNKKMKWELVEEGIGDNVLYLSHASCFVCTADNKTMANRIYFPMLYGDSPVFYSLSDCKYHSLDGEYSSTNTYGLKRLDFAAWLTPSLITTSTSELTMSGSTWKLIK